MGITEYQFHSSVMRIVQPSMMRQGILPCRSVPYRMRFCRNDRFVEVAFDGHRSFELALVIGRLAEDGAVRDWFELRELLSLERAARSAGYPLIQVTDERSLESALSFLVNEIATLIPLVIADGTEIFEELRAQRERDARSHALERNLLGVRSRLDDAWKSRDWQKVVTLLQPYLASLSESERRKLAYARRAMRPQ